MIEANHRQALFFHLFYFFFLLHVLRTSHVVRERAYIVGWGGRCCTKYYLFIYIRRSSVHPNDIFKNVFIFDWRIIALQYCVGFCQTSI